MKVHLVSLATLFNTICVQSLHHREGDIDEQKGGLRKRLAAAHEIPHIDENLLFPRNLNELPCNVPFKTMTIEEIKGTLNTVFLLAYDRVPLQEYTSIIQDKVPLAEFDVQFMRVSTIPVAAGRAINMYRSSATFASSANHILMN